MKKISDLSISLFLLGFSLLLLRNFIPTTALSMTGMVALFYRLLRYSGYLVLFFSLYLRRKINRRYFYVVVCFSALMLIISEVSSYKVVTDYWFCIAFSNGIPFQKIIRRYTRVISVGILLTILACKAGALTNYIYYSSRGTRESLGFIYPTDFAAHMFYLSCAITYLFRKKIRLWHGLIYVAVAFIMYEITISRAGCYMIPTSFIALYLAKALRKLQSKLTNLLLLLDVPICAALTYVMVLKYDASSAFWRAIDSLTSGRLRYGIHLLLLNRITLFGQYVVQRGNGHGKAHLSFDEYTYIDMSFMRILVMYGIVFFVLLLAYCVLLNYKCLKNNEYLIPALLLMIAINSIIAQHFVDFSYNVFLLCFFTDIESFEPSRIRFVFGDRRLRASYSYPKKM